MAVTLREVAQEAGVSVTTASRALGGFDDVAQQTRELVEETARSLGYIPNLAARRLKKQRTDTIGFIIPTADPRFADPFFADFLAGIGNEAARHSYDLLISTQPPHSEAERLAYKRAVAGGWVDGVIIVRTRLEDERIQYLHDHQFPFVAYGRTELPLDYMHVDEDSQAGLRRLVQHLVKLGHKRIAFIAPPQDLMFGRLRLESYRESMASHGLPLAPGWIVKGLLTQRSGETAMAQLLELEPRPTAVIAGNDLMAIGAMHYATKRGLTIGQDISIAGFDNVPTAAYTSPPLTTLSQPIYEIGRQTCAMLIDVLNQRQPERGQVLLTPELIVRGSSGPAPD